MRATGAARSTTRREMVDNPKRSRAPSPVLIFESLGLPVFRVAVRCCGLRGKYATVIFTHWCNLLIRSRLGEIIQYN
jgi:hypothetical protein